MHNTMKRAGRPLVALGLGLLLTGGGFAQTRSDEGQKPELRTYQSEERPTSEPVLESYEDENEQETETQTRPGSDRAKPELETYRTAPAPPPSVENPLIDRTPVESRRGDSQKRTLQTYDSEPAPPGEEKGPQPAPAPSTLDPDSWPSLEEDLEPIPTE